MEKAIDESKVILFEGNVKKWVNPFKRWTLRFMVLNQDVLQIYKNSSKSKLSIAYHVKFVNVKESKPCHLTLSSGSHSVSLKCLDHDESKRWIRVIEGAKAELESEILKSQAVSLIESTSMIAPRYTQMLLSLNHEKSEKLLSKIFSESERFNTALDDAISLFKPDLRLTANIAVIKSSGANIKIALKEMLISMEREKKRLFRIATVLSNDENGGNMRGLDVESKIIQAAALVKQDSSIPGEEFQSFIENNYYYKESQSFAILSQFEKEQDNKQLVPDEYSDISLVDFFAKRCPVRLLSSNPAYVATSIATNPSREGLPVEKDPNEKVNIWSVIKDSIGKDLSKFAVPIYMNEPLSMLQRLAEQMEYAEILDLANATDDEGLALSYVMGFGVSLLAGTINRLKKPFNPLLGETFELIDAQKGFRFIGEQVSHHPPISAGFAESENYFFWGDSNLSTQFWGKSMEIKPLSSMHVVLRRLKHSIVYKKCLSAAKNILIGTMYLDHYGEMKFENQSNGMFGSLVLKEKGMWSCKGQYEIAGCVKNAEGKVLYNLAGHWNDRLVATHAVTGKEVEVWKRRTLPKNAGMNYHFTEFSMQLNHLDAEKMKEIAPTDSRLRPDQRALEFGLLDIASEEKIRLEQKQRAAKKDLEEAGGEYKPNFFQEIVDNTTKEKEFKYVGRYWETRNTGDWKSLNLPDIF